jgi:hypothetical protein
MGGTKALIADQEKNVWVFPAFMFSGIGIIIISLYAIKKKIRCYHDLRETKV